MKKITVRWTKELDFSLPSTPFSHFQTEAYAELLPAYHQSPEWMCLENEDKNCVAAWLFFQSPHNYVRPPKNPLLKFLDVHYFSFHSPTFSEGLTISQKEKLIPLMVKALQKRCQKLQPIQTVFLLSPLLSEEEAKIWEKSAQACALNLSPSYTYLAEISPDPEAVFSQIKSDRRTKVRRMQELGYEFIEVDSLELLRKYYALRNETTAHNALERVPWEHFQRTFEVLHPKGIYKIFLLKVGDRYGAGQTAFAHNEYLYLSGVSLAAWAREEKIAANDALQFEILKWASQKGLKYVDFVGAKPHSTDPKAKNIDYFKSRWGTEVKTTWEIKYPPSPLRSLALRVAEKGFRLWEHQRDGKVHLQEVAEY